MNAWWRDRLAAALIGGVLAALPGRVAGDAGDACAGAITQLDLNVCSNRQREAAEARVDAETAALGEALRAEGDAARMATLSEADTAWRAYRDAHCRLAGDVYAGGSIQPMIVALCRARLAESRLRDLNDLLPER